MNYLILKIQNKKKKKESAYQIPCITCLAIKLLVNWWVHGNDIFLSFAFVVFFFPFIFRVGELFANLGHVDLHVPSITQGAVYEYFLVKLQGRGKNFLVHFFVLSCLFSLHASYHEISGCSSTFSA